VQGLVSVPRLEDCRTRNADNRLSGLTKCDVIRLQPGWYLRQTADSQHPGRAPRNSLGPTRARQHRANYRISSKRTMALDRSGVGK
jgi:hypothetical protein